MGSVKNFPRGSYSEYEPEECPRRVQVERMVVKTDEHRKCGKELDHERSVSEYRGRQGHALLEIRAFRGKQG